MRFVRARRMLPFTIGVVPTGSVTESVVVPVAGPPPSSGKSAFEREIKKLDPVVQYDMRDGNFNNRIRDRAGSNHLIKQIAAATRSAVQTRTTHPGGILFDAVTAANWAADGQFYKGPTGVLNGASAYTMLVSIRFLSRTGNGQTFFGLGTEGTTINGNNYLLNMYDSSLVGETGRIRHRTGTGNDNLDPTITGRVEDGVNRLFTVRSTGSSSQILKISKPGASYVTEDTASQAALNAINRALLLNAQDDTVQDSPSFVIDQIALWDSDIGAAAEENLHDLWAAELGGYYPSMMQFDGSTGYYSDASFTSTGNKLTFTARFQRASFTGNDQEIIGLVTGASAIRLLCNVVSSNHSTLTNRQSKIYCLVQNSAGTAICRLVSNVTVLDDEPHQVFFSFDGDTGTATFTVDGVAADDTGNADRVAPTTGTLDSGTAAGIGGSNVGGDLFGGKLGMVGFRDAYQTNATDFGTGALPAAINEVDWTEFDDTQPSIWSHTAQLDNNKGSAGDMTENGTITMTEGGSP